jgi:putative oxidoreductase
MTKQYEWGLLLLRLVLGLSFAMHGYAKFTEGIENTSDWFDSMGIPGILAYGVALLEIMGGLALMAGLATRLLAAFYVIVMLVAIVKVKLVIGFLGGYELDLVFLSISLALFISGGGLYSIDRALFPSRISKEKR